MTEPYKSTKLMPFDDYSLFPPNNRVGITYINETYGITLAIEIGSYLGASSRYIASLLPSEGKLYCVDKFDDYDHRGNIKKKGFGTLYDQFLSNVIISGYTDKIIPIKNSSINASMILTDLKPDFIYLDASHKYKDVVDDINAWYPYLEEK